MLTPNDLKAIEQLFDKKLEAQTKTILDGVADYISDALVPLLDKHEKRLEHLEAHTSHPPGTPTI
jgi:hypothetical protein